MEGVARDAATTTSVVRLAAAGDTIAFARIVAEHHADMVRVAYVVAGGDQDVADDAVGSAWSIAWRKLRTLRDPERLKPWLVSVAANEARQLCRRRRRWSAPLRASRVLAGLTVVFLVAGCVGAAAPSPTTAPSPASPATSPTTAPSASPSPRPTARAEWPFVWTSCGDAPGDPSLVVALGTSETAGWSLRRDEAYSPQDAYPGLYADILCREIGVPVELHSYFPSQLGNELAPLSWWIAKVTDDAALRSDLAAANVVVLWAMSSHDIVRAQFLPGACSGAWPDPLKSCLEKATAHIPAETDELFGRIADLVPEGATVLAGDAFAPPVAISSQADRPYRDEVKAMVDPLYFVEPMARKHGFTFVDTELAFNGPSRWEMPEEGLVDHWRIVNEPFSYQFFEAARNLAATLRVGITTVRDGGGADLGVKRAVADGLLPGPRLRISLVMLSQTGGHGDDWFPSGARVPLMVAHPGRPDGIIDGPDEARRKVRQLVGMGADVVKIATSGGVLSPRSDPRRAHFRPAELATIVEEATAAGIGVMAHAQAADGIKNAIRAGVRSIEHGVYLDDEAISLMLEHGTWLVPTLVAPQGVLDAAAAGAPIAPAMLDKARMAIDVHREAFRRAVAAGVRIAMGTDSGVTQHGRNLRELALMAAGGMRPADVLVATTSSAAELLGVADELGTIEVGKRADIVVVDGDPFEFDGLDDRIAAVWQDGRLVAGYA